MSLEPDIIIDLQGLKSSLETMDEDKIFASTLANIIREYAQGDVEDILILPAKKDEKANKKTPPENAETRKKNLKKEAEERAMTLGEKVLFRFDGVNATQVYLGTVDRLVPVIHGEFWHHDMAADAKLGGDGFGDYATLNDISDYCINKGENQTPLFSGHDTNIVTVFTYGPLSGKVYQYGNHGPFWEEYGELRGYA